MGQVRKTMHLVAAALAVAGIVLMAAGFTLSGFDLRVFSVSVDRGAVVLGGREVADPDSVPLLGTLAEWGRMEVNVSEPPDAPRAPDLGAPSAA